jgi:hypothetical protein
LHDTMLETSAGARYCVLPGGGLRHAATRAAYLGRHRHHQILPRCCIAIAELPALPVKPHRFAVPEAVLIPRPQRIPGRIYLHGRRQRGQGGIKGQCQGAVQPVLEYPHAASTLDIAVVQPPDQVRWFGQRQALPSS